ncbi:Hint domain-containing protein, partial [Methylobrevis albus]
ALGSGVPHTDLYLSADHGMIVDGLVVNAGALVNGDGIRFVSLSAMPKRFGYYHVETEAHDEILANGAPAETFVDYVGRKDFENYAEYLALYGSERLIPEMRRVRIS